MKKDSLATFLSYAFCFFQRQVVFFLRKILMCNLRHFSERLTQNVSYSQADEPRHSSWSSIFFIRKRQIFLGFAIKILNKLRALCLDKNRINLIQV